jgi:hypothetical protein
MPLRAGALRRSSNPSLCFVVAIPLYCPMAVQRNSGGREAAYSWSYPSETAHKFGSSRIDLLRFLCISLEQTPNPPMISL